MKDIIEKNFESQLRFLEQVVEIDSGSSNIKGVNTVSEIIKQEFIELGFAVTLIPYEKAGNCLIADFKNDERKIVLLGHMDTVFPDGTAKKRPFTIVEGKAYGPGVLDMKGGISQIVFALKALKEQGVLLNRIQVLLVGDEEVGHEYSDVVEVIKELSKTTDYVFCCESGRIDGKLVTGRKGVAGLTFKTYGKSAHAGNEYSKGINAITELAHKIVSIQSFTEPNLSLTINPGYVSGGGAINIVPEFAEAGFDIRIEDLDRYSKFEEALKVLCVKTDIPGTRCDYTLRLEYPPMNHNEHTNKMLDLVNRVCKDKGYPLTEVCAVGGGADSSFFAQFGVPVLCGFGPKGEYNHTAEEYILIDGLKERTSFLAECIKHIENLQ